MFATDFLHFTPFPLNYQASFFYETLLILVRNSYCTLLKNYYEKKFYV